MKKVAFRLALMAVVVYLVAGHFAKAHTKAVHNALNAHNAQIELAAK